MLKIRSQSLGLLSAMALLVLAGCGGQAAPASSAAPASASAAAAASPAASTAAAKPAASAASSTAAAAKPASGAAAAKPSYAPNSRLAQIVSRGKLVLGTKDDLPGIGYLNPKTNKIEGFSVDMADSLATKIFGEPGHLDVKAVTAATRIPTLQQDTVDVNLETTFITKDRKQQVDFADPYWGSGTRVFVKATNNAIHSPQDLVGKTVATTKGSTGVEFLKDYPGIKFLELDNTADAVEAVRSGRADATAFDESMGLSFMTLSKDFKFGSDSFVYSYYGIAIKKGQDDFLGLINDWLQQVKSDGTWKKLFVKNFPTADPQDPPQPPYDKAEH